VEGAPLTAGEARAVEEDAGAVHHPGAGPGAVAEDAVGRSFGVVLEALRLEPGGAGGHRGAVVAVEGGADRAAALAEGRRRLGEDALAPAAEGARPPGGEEGRVEAPRRLAVVDLHQRVVRRPVHGDEATGGSLPGRVGCRRGRVLAVSPPCRCASSSRRPTSATSRRARRRWPWSGGPTSASRRSSTRSATSRGWPGSRRPPAGPACSTSSRSQGRARSSTAPATATRRRRRRCGHRGSAWQSGTCSSGRCSCARWCWSTARSGRPGWTPRCWRGSAATTCPSPWWRRRRTRCGPRRASGGGGSWRGLRPRAAEVTWVSAAKGTNVDRLRSQVLAWLARRTATEPTGTGATPPQIWAKTSTTYTMPRAWATPTPMCVKRRSTRLA
jgi:hypothetical protein